MKYRKSRFPYLIYSLIIHIVMMICVAWFYVINTPPLPEPPILTGDLFPIPRPSTVKPKKPLVEPTLTETNSSIEEKVNTTPVPPKPTVDLVTNWLAVNSDEENETLVGIRRIDIRNDIDRSEGADTKNYSDVPHTKITDKPKIRSTPQNINREEFAFSPSNGISQGDLQVNTSRIELGLINTLSGVSPSVSAPNIQYGSKRGDALRATSMSNTWGGGGSSVGNQLTGTYRKMMKAIADELIEATTSEKVDIVLLLDETASMVDNISGIRAYFDIIFDAFARDKRDVTYGLLTFTDKTKTYGMTDKLGKFKNWMFKIDVDHGGDISEAGLDALMSAVNKFKFRPNAQRFFILASDAAFHDADYDGKSRYSLDEAIATLQKERIRVEVIGLDYLPIKQIALATGGTWRAIPGKGYLEYVPLITQTMKMLSKLGTLSIDDGYVGDKIIVYVNNPPRPKKLILTWKVLNPLGERCYGPITKTTEIPDDGSTNIEMLPILDKTKFQSIPGIYTVIYKLENDRGHKSILRRTISHQQ